MSSRQVVALFGGNTCRDVRMPVDLELEADACIKANPKHTHVWRQSVAECCLDTHACMMAYTWIKAYAYMEAYGCMEAYAYMEA